MSNRIIGLMLAITFGLVVAVFVLNNLWARMFGGAAIPQPVSREQQTADRQKLREENAARARAKRERERHSAETLRAAARAGVPAPLAAEQFNPATGKVQWPEALLGEAFVTRRETLDRLLQQRAGAPNEPERAAMAHAAAEELLAHLNANIRELPTNEYVAARRFMDSLIFALRPARTTTPSASGP